MLKTIRKSLGFFFVGTVAAIVIRLIFILRFPSITTDSFVYGEIAKNWLQHGVYGFTGTSEILPTYIRLPGYPAFLAGIFAVFGMENYRAALFIQMVVDIGSCFLICDLARRVVGVKASKTAFLLAALCPFMANYVATALTETLEIFFTALSLNLAVAGLESAGRGRRGTWVSCGIATGAAILLRPDGGILLIAIELFLAWKLIDNSRHQQPVLYFARAAFIIGIVSLALLIPWTLRNLDTMHRFQPLAPRYANEQDEFVPAGFNRWVKTWIADYTSVEEVYWSVPDEPVNPAKLPDRAFDSDKQRQETVRLISEYNDALTINLEMDARFAGLAEERIRSHPLRYYVWLPALRIADMWLRPRTEMLPSDSRWWEFNDDLKGSAFAVALGLIGIFYVACGVAGLARGKAFQFAGLLLTFVIVRSLFLGSLENPEPRYTLECFPVVIVFAAAMLRTGSSSTGSPSF